MQGHCDEALGRVALRLGTGWLRSGQRKDWMSLAWQRQRKTLMGKDWMSLADGNDRRSKGKVWTWQDRRCNAAAMVSKDQKARRWAMKSGSCARMRCETRGDSRVRTSRAAAKTRNERKSAEGAMRRQAMLRGAEVSDSRAETRGSMALEGSGTIRFAGASSRLWYCKAQVCGAAAWRWEAMGSNARAMRRFGGSYVFHGIGMYSGGEGGSPENNDLILRRRLP